MITLMAYVICPLTNHLYVPYLAGGDQNRFEILDTIDQFIANIESLFI